MRTFKFGRKQIVNPTPASISFKITLISVIAPAISTWLGTATYIPTKISFVLISILSLIVTLANVLRPFFGVAIDSSSIPSEEVKEVEDKPQP